MFDALIGEPRGGAVFFTPVYVAGFQGDDPSLFVEDKVDELTAERHVEEIKTYKEKRMK
ncbi:MAG: hypothetical protein ACI8ZB_000167 [Desulforhopalus sp.]